MSYLFKWKIFPNHDVGMYQDKGARMLEDLKNKHVDNNNRLRCITGKAVSSVGYFLDPFPSKFNQPITVSSVL